MRKPDGRPDAAPYASLRQTEAAATASKGTMADHIRQAANEFKIEADKLKALREALWAAFEAGPEAGLPNTLIDLTMAYTNALRLQLNLRAVALRQPAVKVAPIHKPSATPSAAE